MAISGKPGSFSSAFLAFISSMNFSASIRANNGFIFFTTSVSSNCPKRSKESKSRISVPIASKIFSLVSGKKLFKSTALKRILSNKLYKTVAKRSFLASSLASTHGSVSSIYLLVRRNKAKISSKASPTWKESICFVTFSKVASAKLFNSWSTSSSTCGLLTLPSKYLFDMAIVRETKLPNTFAKSLLILSITNSQVIVPSWANGISCKQ
ncbi:Uncharacterised protein [Chlamydia trachomatis]|nr:Uncharacterised protein [Chlamydia trachomatis]